MPARRTDNRAGNRSLPGKPRSILPLDQICLGKVYFWSLPHDVREGAFVTLRRERPVSFHEETEIPSA